MNNLFRTQSIKTLQSGVTGHYDVMAELGKHGWHPDMDTACAEEALVGKSAYTYAIYPRAYERGFVISFVNAHGFVEHHPLTLLSPVHGIWRNHGSCNIGTIIEVICMMLYGNEGQPL